MTTFVIRRVLPIVGLLVVMGAAVRQQVVPGPDNDLYFHLRFGREFVDGWSIGAPGHLGAHDSADWAATQWLSQVILSTLEESWGLGAVLWLVGTLIVALVVVLYVSCRREASPLAASLVTALVYVCAAPGLGPRPQLASYVLIAVVGVAWLQTMDDRRPRWWLLAVAWLWPMVHGMWIVGVLMGAAVVVGLALERATPRRRLVQLALIPAGSLVLAGCTPAGWGTYQSLVAIGSRSVYFTEWGPPDLVSATGAPLLVLVGLVVLGGMRRGPVRWPEALWIGLAVLWAIYSVRTAPVAALMLAPLAARAVQGVLPASSPLSRQELAVVLGAATLASAVLVPVGTAREDRQVVPSWVDERLDGLPPGSTVLDEWDFGPYLLWRHPDLDVLLHGYGDVFTDAELVRNAGISRLAPGWREEVASLDPDVALVDPDSALGYALVGDGGWQVVESDDDYVLLVPAPDAGL